jgi:hypothetical protein
MDSHIIGIAAIFVLALTALIIFSPLRLKEVIELFYLFFVLLFQNFYLVVIFVASALVLRYVIMKLYREMRLDGRMKIELGSAKLWVGILLNVLLAYIINFF